MVDSGSQLIKRLAGPDFRAYLSRFYLNLRFIALVPIPLAAVSRVSACIAIDVTAVSPRLPFVVLFFVPINHVITLVVVVTVAEMVLGSNTPAPSAVPVLALKVLDVYIPSVAGLFSPVIKANIFGKPVAHVVVVHVTRVSERFIPTFFMIMLTCTYRALDLLLLPS